MDARLCARMTLIFVLAFCLSFTACVKNPVTGKRQLVMLSEGQEIAIGQESHEEVLAQFGRVEDDALQEYFSGIGRELARSSHRPNLPWNFVVVDSPVVNAFAVPGGYVYLTRGILEHMNNEAELAAVLGHEIGHITARHSVTQISQGQLMNLGLGLGSIFSTRFQQVGGLAQMGLEVLMLKFSRDHEREADQLGLEYMAKCGYDPEQMSRFFQVFNDMSESSEGAVPNWLSTHPSPPDRIQRTSQEGARLKRAAAGQSFKLNAGTFMPRLEKLAYGDNPREGFVDNGRFVHPELRFQFDIPVGWQVENTKSAVLVAEPQGGAVIQLSLASSAAGQSPSMIGRTIGNQDGTQMVSGRDEKINGKTAFTGIYRLQSDSGILAATAAFIGHGSHIYQLVGFAPESGFSQYRRSMESALRSFRDLTDSRLLSVQPDRIKLVQARSGDTLRKLAQSMNQTRISLEDLAKLNRLSPDQALKAGTWVKLVQPGRR